MACGSSVEVSDLITNIDAPIDTAPIMAAQMPIVTASKPGLTTRNAPAKAISMASIRRILIR